LVQEYTVEFDTNLSFDISKFTARIKSGKVKFAAAFHPEFINIDHYLEKVLKLRDEGFDMGVNYVAYPFQLDRMEEYKAKFEENDISFTIMPFRGEFKGRIYPAGYTKDEKNLIKKCDGNLAISSNMLKWYADKKPSRQNRVCRMGQMYAKIHPDGTAYRCCYIDDRGKLGNIIKGNFSLLSEPKSCEYPECPCWTAMVVGEEEKWLSHWALPR